MRSGRRGRRFKSCHSDQAIIWLFAFFPNAFKLNHRFNRLTSLSDTSAAIAAAVPPSGPSVQYATTAAYDALNRPTGISWNPAPTPPRRRPPAA